MAIWFGGWETSPTSTDEIFQSDLQLSAWPSFSPPSLHSQLPTFPPVVRRLFTTIPDVHLDTDSDDSTMNISREYLLAPPLSFDKLSKFPSFPCALVTRVRAPHRYLRLPRGQKRQSEVLGICERGIHYLNPLLPSAIHPQFRHVHATHHVRRSLFSHFPHF